jgi:hypothetical protein
LRPGRGVPWARQDAITRLCTRRRARLSCRLRRCTNARATLMSRLRDPEGEAAHPEGDISPTKWRLSCAT